MTAFHAVEQVALLGGIDVENVASGAHGAHQPTPLEHVTLRRHQGDCRQDMDLESSTTVQLRYVQSQTNDEDARVYLRAPFRTLKSLAPRVVRSC